MWRQDRQLADLLPLYRAPEVGGMVRHPKLGNDFSNQLSVTEQSHHRTLRNHNAHSIGHSTHVGGGNVTAAESQWHLHLCGHIDVFRTFLLTLLIDHSYLIV